MSEHNKQPTPTRTVWRSRAIAAAEAIAAKGHDVALMRFDLPHCHVQCVLNGKLHKFETYREAALRLEAWGEVL